MTFCEDTEHIYEQVIREIAASYDKEYFWEVRVRLLGTTEQNTSKIAVTELGLPITVEEFRTQFSTMGRQRLNDVGMMKGVHNGCMWCSFYCFCLAYNNLDCLFPDEITIESYPFCFVFGFIAKLDFFFFIYHKQNFTNTGTDMHHIYPLINLCSMHCRRCQTFETFAQEQNSVRSGHQFEQRNGRDQADEPYGSFRFVPS